MKIKNVPGEYAFKALFKTGNGWKLSDEYFFNQKEVVHFFEGYEVVWPVELLEDEQVYVPSQEELE